jgi:hypothetical protein
MKELTEENFLLYCAKHYNNPHSSGTDEFLEDLNRIKYIKKLLTRYEQKGELKERLILNHIIILCNVFGPKACVDILFLKMTDQLHFLKPFLVLLQILPEIIEIDGKLLSTDDIQMDIEISKTLSKI